MKMRLGISVLLSVFVVNAIVFTLTCPVLGATTETNAVVDSNDASVVPPDCVARIGDYTITRDELMQRWKQEIQPKRESNVQPTEPMTGDVALRKVLAERAMSIEGRKLGYLEDDGIEAAVDRYRRKMLSSLLANDFVNKNIKITDEEIAKEIKADPNLTSDKARMRILRAKANPALRQFYLGLLKELELKKHTDNFAKAAEIYQRLLLKPKEPRGQNMYWITTNQIRTELTEEEKNLVLASFTGGKVTLYDWFTAIGDIAPPGRPKDLNTPAGVEKMLERAIAPVIVEAKAIKEGLDKNPQYLKELREVEDRYLMGKVRSEKIKSVKEPSETEIKTYFDEHPEMFAQGGLLKVEQIWCDTLEAAEQAKKRIEAGESFEAVEKSLSPESKSRGIHNTYPTAEGIFWHQLSEAKLGSLVGPLKGFQGRGLMWRIVKVHEKKAPEVKPWSDQMANQAKSTLMSEQREEMMDKYEAELLEKYPYTIYPEHFKELDPLAVVPAEANEPQ